MSYRPVDQHPESNCIASCSWTLVQNLLVRILEHIVIYRYISYHFVTWHSGIVVSSNGHSYP